MFSEHTKAELYNKLFSRRKEILEHARNLKDQWLADNYSQTEFGDKAQQEYTYLNLNKLDVQARKEVQIIDRALDKMQFGDYGICENCGQEISEKRLQALPWATMCVECVQKLEEENQNIPPEEDIQASSEKQMFFGWNEVDQDIQVLNDEELLELIQQAIHDDGRIETDELNISCTDSMIYLQGVVPNELQYNLLFGVLQDIVDLDRVVDNLRIDSLTPLIKEEWQDVLGSKDPTDEELLWHRDDL